MTVGDTLESVLDRTLDQGSGRSQMVGRERPILNLPLFAKLWSRMRRPLCEEWESRHKEDCFWGSSTSTCDRASWIHNTLMAFAQGDMNLAAGTG